MSSVIRLAEPQDTAHRIASEDEALAVARTLAAEFVGGAEDANGNFGSVGTLVAGQRPAGRAVAARKRAGADHRQSPAAARQNPLAHALT